MLVVPIITLALVALVAWFWRTCITRGPKEPPRAWLSAVPPLVAYGKDPTGFLRRARATYGDVFTVPAPGVSLTFMFDNSSLRYFFDAPEAELSFMKGVVKIVGHLFGPELLEAGPYEDLLNQVILKGLHQVRAVSVCRHITLYTLLSWLVREIVA